MSASSKMVVGEGTERWLRLAVDKMRPVATDPGALVVVFRDPAGPIGFDLNPTSEKLFCSILGEGLSVCSKDKALVRYEGGDATAYVKSLFVGGLTLPITVAGSPIRVLPSKESADGAALAASIYSLSKMDIDDDTELLSEGIAKIALDCSRVCIPFVAQWFTNIITPQREKTLHELELAAQGVGVEFEYVPDERMLPQW
jgi:hypothetical protein